MDGVILHYINIGCLVILRSVWYMENVLFLMHVNTCYIGRGIEGWPTRRRLRLVEYSMLLLHNSTVSTIVFYNRVHISKGHNVIWTLFSSCTVPPHWVNYVILFRCVQLIILVWSAYSSSCVFSSILSGLVNISVCVFCYLMCRITLVGLPVSWIKDLISLLLRLCAFVSSTAVTEDQTNKSESKAMFIWLLIFGLI